MLSNIYIVDCEVYPNFFCVGLQNADGKVLVHEARGRDARLSDKAIAHMRSLLATHYTCGYNSIDYDIPILTLALKGATAGQIRAMSDDMIVRRMRWWDALKARGIYSRMDTAKHIDLIRVCTISSLGERDQYIKLKQCGARLHCQSIEDLPFSPEIELTEEQMDHIVSYCGNDLVITRTMLDEEMWRVQLRADLGEDFCVDPMWKGDAELAEYHIRKKLQVKPPYGGATIPSMVRYTPPDWIKLQGKDSKEFYDMVSTTPIALSQYGRPETPEAWNKKLVDINGMQYRVGMGGLHSDEFALRALPGNGTLRLAALDVASYYPLILLAQDDLYPRHCGQKFTKYYRQMVEKRLAAKAAGDKATADVLKIVVNGTFGKMGSRYSVLFEPSILAHIVLTGQLGMLMLIEYLEMGGVRVLSANTDGVFVMGREPKIKAAKGAWERESGMELEYDEYDALYGKDVNNYFALAGNSVKGKGMFAEPGVRKNPDGNIIGKAILEFARKGTPIAETVMACNDVREFMFVRRSQGRAVWRGKDCGSVVRFVWANTTDDVKTAKGHAVPNGRGVVVLEDLPDKLPLDISKSRYIIEAEDLSIQYGIDYPEELCL